MNALPTLSDLAPWQRDFVERFAVQHVPRSLLVAAPGTGKTTTSLIAAKQLLNEGVIDSVLVLAYAIVLRQQWAEMSHRCGLEVTQSIKEPPGQHGIAVTVHSLRQKGAADELTAVMEGRRWLVIVDDLEFDELGVASLVDRILFTNTQNRALFLSTTVPSHLSTDAEFRFSDELLIDVPAIQAEATQLSLARFAPSILLLQKLQQGVSGVDGLSWREFEKLIAALLERDGYTVELMQGSKDGGVDVVAVKDLGPNGLFKALWQAKKQGVGSKVGISVVRELADTRQEFGASKGIIVTSSYLTRGALNRIERQKYLLGKVDRSDLDAWIKHTLFGRTNQ